MAKKQQHTSAATCENCGECMYIGEGAYVCDFDYSKIVIDDFTPTADYLWCSGKYFNEEV